MADVRSLLRNELAARQRASPTGSSGMRVTKKRKVADTDTFVRKKLRSVEAQIDQTTSEPEPIEPSASGVSPAGSTPVETVDDDAAGPELPPSAGGEEMQSTQLDSEPLDTRLTTSTAISEQPQNIINEDEWAAFERDVVAATRVPEPLAALAAAPTISAVPVSAEELAAQKQQQEKQSLTRTRETEAQGEREDAARFLEDEFDEMEQLEERVRRLKNMREALRSKIAADGNVPAQDLSTDRHDAEEDGGADRDNRSLKGDSDDEDDDDDGDDAWADWRFR